MPPLHRQWQTVISSCVTGVRQHWRVQGAATHPSGWQSTPRTHTFIHRENRHPLAHSRVDALTETHSHTQRLADTLPKDIPHTPGAGPRSFHSQVPRHTGPSPALKETHRLSRASKQKDSQTPLPSHPLPASKIQHPEKRNCADCRCRQAMPALKAGTMLVLTL